MEKEKSLLGVFDAASHLDWTKKRTPALFSVLLIVGLSAIAAALAPLGIKLPPSLYVWLFMGTEVCAIAYWLYVRWYRPFDVQMLSIGFALHTDQYSKEFYDEIMASLRREIEEQGLSELVQIRRLPTDLNFRSNKEAEKYLTDKGLRVLIWGDTTHGTVRGENVSTFNVRFSCQYTVQSEGGKRELHAVFQDGTRRGMWSVAETDSLEGIKVVTGNLIEVGAYVLAISLWTAGSVKHVEKAAGILERLSIRMASQSQGANFPNLDEFKQKTGNYLRHVYWGLTNYYLVQKRDYKTALIWAQKLYELGPRNYDVNMHMARIAWELGDQSAARTYTKTARIAKPKEALPYLNLAFFHFYNGSYSKALAYYKRLGEKVFKTNIIDVVDFLEREYDKTGKEALYFAAGWLSYRFGDKERGRVMLLEFKERAKNHGELEKLVKEVDNFELGEQYTDV